MCKVLITASFSSALCYFMLLYVQLAAELSTDSTQLAQMVETANTKMRPADRLIPGLILVVLATLPATN